MNHPGNKVIVKQKKVKWKLASDQGKAERGRRIYCLQNNMDQLSQEDQSSSFPFTDEEPKQKVK